MKAVRKLCQATLTLVLAISMVFGTGIKGVFADEISTEYEDAVQEQTEFMNLIAENKDSYEKALELLSSVEELDSEYQETIIDCIDTLISNPEATQEDIDSLEALKELVVAGQETYATYSEIDDNEKTLYSQNLQTLVLSLANEENIDGLNELFANIITIVPDFGLATAVTAVSSAELSELVVNGLPLDVNETTSTMYVGYEVVNPEVIVTPVLSTTKIEIVKPSELVVGNNEIKIVVTPLSGETIEYIITVVRLDEFADQGDGTDETTKTTPAIEPMVATQEEETTTSTYVSNTYSSEETTTEVEDDDKEAVEEEYDEELEEEKGLNGLTILLIVAGIALIGFGIYMLFGDKDDDVPTVKAKKDTKVNSKPNNTNKKQNKTKKRK